MSGVLSEQSLSLADGDATEAAGARLAAALAGLPDVRFQIFLHGDLGAGKTTFSRGVLCALGYTGRVPSPTYTLIEPYELVPRPVYHMDLYRLRDGAELEFLALDDLPANALFLVEWPERAGRALGPPDLVLQLTLDGAARKLHIAAMSVSGAAVLGHF
ncbi:MAG: tRNA (adenosine(37)-N6)-threonylcarbamoyltransferase complex ATPase subunit type 1 TsaE [Gammaproteobacteria bacterium]|nr:tRNA (adenosine(37)-N6)-threonylcarbamoyltransferase complex ATPase subunit type 1 TsaE [Gammaproteobacteria bacterium]